MRFVESAELRIVDNSTKQLNQIDRKLRALGVTARALKGTLAGLTMPTVPTKGVAAVTAALTAQSRAAAAAARSMERLGASYAGAGRGADRFAAAASHADAEARRLGISRVGVTVSTAQGVAELRKLGAAAQALKRDLSSLALPQLRMAGADGLRKFHSDVRTLKSDLASLAVPQLRAPALAGMATLRAELRAAKAELASLELPQLRAPALDGFKTFRAEIRAAKADIAGLVLPQLRAPNLSPLRQLETEARKAKSALDALMFPPLHVPSPGGIKKLGVEARALKATLDAIAFPALHVPGTADLRKFRAEALVLQRELAGLFIPQLRTPSTAGLKKIATAARNASAELSWLVIPKLHAPSLAPLKKIRDEARKARGELDGLAIPPLRAPSLAGLKKVGAEARKVSAELAGIHIPALHVPSAAGLKSLGAAARTLKAELGSLTMPALHAPSVAPISSVTRAMREQRDAARAAADAVHRLSDAYSVLSRSAPRLGGVVRHTTTNMAGLTAAATGGDWLLEQGRAARAAARGLDRLGTAYASAATKAQRFGSSAASVTQQLHALIGAVGQAKALGKISLGNNLLPGQGGGRRGQGKEKTYSAHLYANPAHSIGNAALSGAFGHDLSLAQALTISAMGSVVVKASHVALEGAKEMSTAHERLFQKGATPEYQDWADREAHRVAAKYKDTSVQDNLETLNDIGAAVHDRGGQAQLMELLAKRQQLMVGQGQDSKEVRDSNVRLIKTLEMSGSLVDQNGHFNAARTEAMLQMIQGVEAVEGRNIDARQVQMAFKYLRENALSQTMGNLRNSLFMAAEVGGSSAGTNIGQAINNLSGHATKEVLANAAQLGLGTAKWETSRSGKRKLVDYQVNDEELLRSDFGGWIEKQLMPKIHDAGIDPKTDVAELSKFLSKIVSRQTSKDALMKWITQHQESANKAEAAGKVKTDEETAERVPERDYTAAFVALEKQMSSAAGDVGKKLNGLILPSVNGAATLFSDLARVVSGTATEAEKSSLVTGGIKATGAGGLALFLGSKLLPMLNPLNGSAVALTGSATALGGSAAALTGAAATLGGAGALGGAGGLAGAAGAAGAGGLLSRSIWQVAGRAFGTVAVGYIAERLGEAWLEKLSPDTGKKVRQFREKTEDELAAKSVDAFTVVMGGSLPETKPAAITTDDRLRLLGDEATRLQKRLVDLGEAYSRDKGGAASRAMEDETADIVKRLERNARAAVAVAPAVKSDVEPPIARVAQKETAEPADIVKRLERDGRAVAAIAPGVVKPPERVGRDDAPNAADIVKRLERDAAAAAGARKALGNFGGDYGKIGGGAGVGEPDGPTIPPGGFLGGATFEAALSKFSEAGLTTISGLKEAASQFERIGGTVGSDIASAAKEGLAGAWGDATQALKAGGDAVAASIRGALAGGVAVHLQQAGPSTGSASPSKQ